MTEEMTIMRFMNHWDIDDAVQRWSDHPVLGPAVFTLKSLRDAADANSDGWAYWPAPAKSAAKLMELIEGNGTWEFFHGEREDATPQKLRAALSPVKAFRTRSGLSFEIFTSLADVEASRQRKAAAFEQSERAELARLQQKYGK